MTRYVLVRLDGNEEVSVGETALPAEALLHDALTRHPELLPTEDFGFGQTIVIGREAVLASGYADLVLIDDRGQICLVEVKKAGNPDTRQVVAQLLDYAGAIWGQSPDEFERSVLLPYVSRELRLVPTPSLSQFLRDRFRPSEDQDADVELAGTAGVIGPIEAGLRATLESGRFVLVVAAPEIPPGVRRALDYLNAQGLRVFGIEISYFAHPVEVFVPRIVVSPPVEIGGGPTSAEPVDRETFVAALPPEAGAFLSELLDECAELGAEITWKPTGPTIKVRGVGGRATLATFEPLRAYLTLIPASGFPGEAYERFRERLRDLGVGTETPAGAWRRVDFASVTHQEDFEALRQAILDMCRIMLGNAALATTEIQPALVVTFERNDYNVWEKTVPDLAKYHGLNVWGTLRQTDDDKTESVQLVPLASGAPGWVPRFPNAAHGAQVWPAGEHTGSFTLRATRVQMLTG